MANNTEILDAGRPAPVTPPAVTDEAVRWGNAIAGIWGKETATTGYGTYLRRIPVLKETQSVSSDRHTTLPGLVQHIQATVGSQAGPKLPIVTGAPSRGQVLVEPQSDGTMLLKFSADDAITECAYLLTPVPAALLAHLAAVSVPA